MTTPAEKIAIVCPSCGSTFEAWHRRSINTSPGLDTFTDEEIRAWTHATCPACGTETALSTLVVDGDVWTVRP